MAGAPPPPHDVRTWSSLLLLIARQSCIIRRKGKSGLSASRPSRGFCYFSQDLTRCVYCDAAVCFSVVCHQYHYNPLSRPLINISLSHLDRGGYCFSQEERFMYPIYPLLCFLAALSLDAGLRVLGLVWPRPLQPTSPRSRRVLSLLLCALAVPLGVSRMLASHRNYGGQCGLHQCSFCSLTLSCMYPCRLF